MFRRRLLRVIGTVFFYLLLALSAVLIGTAIWIRRTFGPVFFDQMLMNVTGAGEGAPESYVSTFIWRAVLAPLAILIALGLVVVILQRYFAYRGHRRRKINVGETRRRIFIRWGRLLFAVTALVVGIAVFGQAVNLGEYIRSLVSPFSMSQYYVAPQIGGSATAVGGQREQPKNLVLIFLESGEEAFGDDSLFEFDMTEPLETATADWQRIDDLEQYRAGGWTMAGLVGSSCGVPLRNAGFKKDFADANMIGSDADGYMSGAVCLGDVLKGAGYTNTFLGGAPAEFASKREFLTTHGYDVVKDMHTWEEEGETEMWGWGLSDGRLMEQAKAEVTRLHDSGQPFNLTMLTLDTHEPTFVHPYCDIVSEEPMASVTQCSMSKVAGFIDYMRDMGYLEDTVVFVTGDHQKAVAEGGVFYEELSPLGKRPLFNRFWDPEDRPLQRSSMDQLSVYATLLDALNLGREDGRAGIGSSALRPIDPDSGSALTLLKEEYENLVVSRSPELYDQLWGLGGKDSLEVAG